MKTSKTVFCFVFSNLLTSFRGCGCLEPILAAQFERWKPTLPSQGHLHMCTLMGHCRQANLLNFHFSGMWKESGVPGENPCHGEQAPSTDSGSGWGALFFLTSSSYPKDVEWKDVIQGPAVCFSTMVAIQFMTSINGRVLLRIIYNCSGLFGT